MKPTLIEREEQGQPVEPPLGRAAQGEALEFGRFRVLLRQRQLLADGMPIQLGTRAFDVLTALIEGDGSLVTKEELLARAWPGIVVAPESVKVQISALRAALGEDRDFVRTEFGRGYRFTAAVRRSLVTDPEPPPAPDAIDAPALREAALNTELSAITAQLACLEDKLAEVVKLLNGKPQHEANPFHRHGHWAGFSDRTKRRKMVTSKVTLFARNG
jgi:DNA-binding winged helix-turn-helix (wHTH) protein